ncbi:hypothetical protein ASD64_14610 [Mesorhizobium sp. Root157]|uniref:hypothetical protein n=1 Tax=Mesorhizobium sp. Root157 TaxID=1736477 RepID=UPI0006FF0C48|nr:hypothetical protein [Mesorhizobium sp. Root157]KQZ99561.1 hypothetical protein ASD64_14610 [Mesorhizobium sp. Root157]
MSKLFAAISLFVMCIAVTSRPAYAYLDPGTASMLLQGLIGGIAAAGAVISLNYQRLKHAIQTRFGKKNDKSDH